MSFPTQTADPIGYDLDSVRPSAAVATLGETAPPERLPQARKVGPAVPELSDEHRRAALGRLNADDGTSPSIAAAKYVRLDPGRARVTGKGHLNLIRTWHVWGEEPRADWLSWLDVVGSGGFVHSWFRGLTPNAYYYFEIAVTGWWRNASSGFKVSSSEGNNATYSASQSYQVQHLFGLFKPTSEMALVVLEPVQLNGLSFYFTDLYRF